MIVHFILCLGINLFIILKMLFVYQIAITVFIFFFFYCFPQDDDQDLPGARRLGGSALCMDSSQVCPGQGLRGSALSVDSNLVYLGVSAVGLNLDPSWSG